MGLRASNRPRPRRATAHEQLSSKGAGGRDRFVAQHSEALSALEQAVNAAELAECVKVGLSRRMTEKHLALMEVEAERAERDECKPSMSAPELLAMIGEVRASRAEIEGQSSLLLAHKESAERALEASRVDASTIADLSAEVKRLKGWLWNHSTFDDEGEWCCNTCGAVIQKEGVYPCACHRE